MPVDVVPFIKLDTTLRDNLFLLIYSKHGSSHLVLPMLNYSIKEGRTHDVKL